jgi:PKD domain/Metallo-peptidase family M12B Reprolysin-like
MRTLSSKSSKCLVFLALATLVPAGPTPWAGEAEVPALFALDSAARHPTTGPLAVPAAREEYLVQLNPETVAANPETLAIELPGFPPLEALRRHFVVYRPDWMSWTGVLRVAGSKDEDTSYIHLGYHGDQLTATIHYEGERFRIVGGKWESHRLVKLADDLSPLPCAFEDSTEKDSDDFGPDAPAIPEVAPLATSRLDVLAVYPKAYFGFGPAAEAGVFNFIADSISLANDVFANSGVDARYNLVGIVPITGSQPPSTGLYEALIWLNGEPTEIVNLRNAFGADIVTIFIPFIWSSNGVCGVANLPRTNGTFVSATSATTQGIVSAPLNKRAYSANRDGCGLGDFTLGHEIGHNYGLRHHDSTNTTVDFELNGRGFVQPSQFATVMGCYCTGCACTGSCQLGSGAICNRIPYFSDPNRVVNSVTIGASDRNNTQAAKNRVASYAAFKAQSSNTPPTANFTVSCTGRTCSFNASTSTDNQTIPVGGYWWDFGDGTTGAGKTVQHTYSFGSFFWVHLVVTDSGGQKDVTLAAAAPN